MTVENWSTTAPSIFMHFCQVW